MIIRLVSLIVCLCAIIAVSISIYDGGWTHLDLPMKLLYSTVGGISTFILGFLILVSDDTIERWNLEAQMRNRRDSLGKPLY